MNREVTKMLRSRSFGGMPLPASTVRKNGCPGGGFIPASRALRALSQGSERPSPLEWRAARSPGQASCMVRCMT
jgi:hypothetical protein